MSVAVAEKPVRTPDVQREPSRTEYQYPGIPTTCDGAEAVVHVEIRISQAAGAYPIVEARWADAPAALQARPPQAVILAEACPDRARASAIDELSKAGLLTDVTGTSPKDDVSTQLAQLTASQNVETELAALKQATPPKQLRPGN